MNVPNLRPFVEEDIAAAVAMAVDLGLSTWSAEDYVAEMKRRDSYLVAAVEGDRIVGFIVGRRVPGQKPSSLEAEIYNIGVERNSQRHGIGLILINDFLAHYRRENVETVWLEVRKANLAAISFYEKVGFMQFAERRNFYSDPVDDAILMSMNLA